MSTYKGLEFRRQDKNGDIIEAIDNKAVDIHKTFQGKNVNT